MMWAAHCHRLEPLSLLYAQWQRPSLERWRKIFFGGVFDKRVGMLFAARRNEYGNVHRRDGVSKTVTKNMWASLVFFKNPKEKEPRKKPLKAGKSPACGGIRKTSLLKKSYYGSARWFPLIMKFSFLIPRMLKVSGFTFGELASSVQPDRNQFPELENKPYGLKENPFPSVDDALLTLHHADAFINLTTLPIGLTLSPILTADDGVKTPSALDVRTTCFDGFLLAMFVRLLATESRHVDVDVFLIKTFSLLKSNVFCSQNVYKNLKCVLELTSFCFQYVVEIGFELRLEVCDINESESESEVRALILALISQNSL